MKQAANSFAMPVRLAGLLAAIAISRCAEARLAVPHGPSDRNGAAPSAAPAPPGRTSLKAAEEPHQQWYDDAATVAQYAEERQGVPGMVYEGANVDTDVAENDAIYTRNIFDEEPSIFGHCVLIRDIAEPLRVGTSILTLRAWSKRDSGRSFNATDNETAAADHATSKNHSAPRPPEDELLVKGGVMDRGLGEDPESWEAGGDNVSSAEERAELKVEMFAFLKSIAGEVAVIPNGYIAQWGSKKKVPIAGYLCTDERGPVLHTLHTPCVPTTLNDDGEQEEPLPVQANMEGSPSLTLNFTYSRSAAPAPAPAATPTSEKKRTAFAEIRSFGRALRKPGDSAKETASAPAAAAAADLAARKYHVYVGNRKLAFADKPTAENFCIDLAKEIADEMGDTEWDPEMLPAEHDAPVENISLPAFVQTARVNSQPDWTKGVKELLVVVMDWAPNDRSRAPFSRQKFTPQHYESKIFPRVREAFQRMSYGQFDVNPTFIPEVVRYKSPRAQYVSQGYPFPGLYYGARESVAGDARYGNYRFEDYDLVFVIAPQQAPIGTKGVAFCGARGAICNGCEELSENFQVMVAVHELGHNLGLFHAGSSSLEYGNVYDWMGNYPDVTGLSYGLGYKLRLGWIPEDSVVLLEDSDVSGLNDVFNIKAFDSPTPPGTGDILGVQLRLGGSDTDIFISYRGSLGEHAGVFVVKQSQHQPDSELIDMACHSPSQQDAALQAGWTYVDPSNQVVVKVRAVTDSVAKVHLYKVPNRAALASIRGRKGFSDGRYKCPRTCTDSDLLVSQFEGCKALADRGYCSGGKIGMGGARYNVGTDLCPKSCQQCESVMAGSPLVDASSACADRNVRIGRKTCSQVARDGECDYSTNLGHIGKSLCPMSCGYCPGPPSTVGSESEFTDPDPAEEHGSTSENIDEDWASQANVDSGSTTKSPEPVSPEPCTDDPEWSDPDGDGCSVYRDFIQQQRLTKAAACNYNDGAAKVYCRATCGTCVQALEDGALCQDKQCPSFLFRILGQCLECADWPSRCGEESFRADCPRTCGVCSGPVLNGTAPHPSTTEGTTPQTSTAPPVTTAGKCEDEDCISAWKEANDSDTVCYKCADYKDHYCGDTQFREACPKSCDVCPETVACQDDWPVSECQEYAGLGWCTDPEHHSTAMFCKSSCGLCSLKMQQEASHIEQSGAAQMASPAFGVRLGLVLFLQSLVHLLSRTCLA